MQKFVITTPEGHHIAVNVPMGTVFGDPGTFPALVKEIANGLLAAYQTYPPAAEV